MITFKTKNLESEFQEIDEKLDRIMTEIETFCHYLWDLDIVVTSIYRNDSSTHNCPKPYHFLDFRSKDWRQSQRDELMMMINRRFKYDPDRPDKHCLIEHDSGQGRHFHCQVCEHTQMAGDDPTIRFGSPYADKG